jgi:hypothetical protein
MGISRSPFPLILLASAILLGHAGPASASSAAVAPGAEQQKHAVATFLPIGDLFKPLIADLKQPRFYVSYHRYQYSDSANAVNISSVGVGESFGLYRAVDPVDNAGWQVSFGGGLLAQFNLDTSSKDLLNTDYFAGVPFSYRRGPLSYRAYLYHQSSHLGDEYLLHANPRRVEFSYEALSVTGSYEPNEWRGYLGGEVIFHKEPHDLKTLTAQAGIEYYGSSPLWGRGVPVGGLDLKSTEEHHWAVNASFSAGLEFRGDPPGDHRYIRIMLDGYIGFNPHGQFYTENMRINYYGAGVYWGF